MTKAGKRSVLSWTRRAIAASTESRSASCCRRSSIAGRETEFGKEHKRDSLSMSLQQELARAIEIEAQLATSMRGTHAPRRTKVMPIWGKRS
jgi:hypothetical protein